MHFEWIEWENRHVPQASYLSDNSCIIEFIRNFLSIRFDASNKEWICLQINHTVINKNSIESCFGDKCSYLI